MNDMNARLTKFETWLLNRLLLPEEREEKLGDLEESFRLITSKNSRGRARLWLWIQILLALPAFLGNHMYWSRWMVTNILKMAFRRIRREKGYSFINITGLAAGIACCLFIFLYIRFEMSFDDYHQDIDRLYRVALNMKTKTGDQKTASSSPMFAPKLRDNYSQVEAAARIRRIRPQMIIFEDEKYFERFIYYAEPDIFRIMTIPLLQGNPVSLLERSNTVVLSVSLATKLFKDENPLGKMIEMNDGKFEVTGIMKDPPRNAHLRFHVLRSFRDIENDEREMHFHNTNFLTYIKLVPGVEASEFEEKIRFLIMEDYGKELEDRNVRFICLLQPLKDIHLHSHLQGEYSQPGNPVYLFIFGMIGMLVLLIACINFMNLSTARSTQRSLEVGLRKVVGAVRVQLIIRFIGETLLLAAFGLAAAIGLAALFRPAFNEITEIEFVFMDFLQPQLLLGMILITVIVGTVAGSYPAFILSSFRPAAVLKNSFSGGRPKAVMRKIFVVGQFVISIFLIIGTFIVFLQIRFMKNKSLGFQKEQKLVVWFSGNADLQNNHLAVKSEFLKYGSIQGATFSSTVPSRGMLRAWVWPSGEGRNKNIGMCLLGVDHNFFSEYRLEMIAGRSFRTEGTPDLPSQAFILNEEAVKTFGWNSPEEALTKKLRDEIPIIGVVKNFHYSGLQQEIEPLVIWINSQYFGYLTLTVDLRNIDQTLAFVRTTYENLFPNEIFRYFFLDEELDGIYTTEERMGKLIGSFTVLGILIACMGLFGLTSFSVQQRTKEIGIRRVLGASLSSILALLYREFIQWILLANLIAWPLAYFVSHKWLQGFAYRMKIEWTLFLCAGISVLLIAVITVSFQLIRAVRSNPVDCLRYE